MAPRAQHVDPSSAKINRGRRVAGAATGCGGATAAPSIHRARCASASAQDASRPCCDGARYDHNNNNNDNGNNDNNNNNNNANRNNATINRNFAQRRFNRMREAQFRTGESSIRLTGKTRGSTAD